MNEKELLPCPFCNGEAAFGSATYRTKISGNTVKEDHGHFVNCIQCGSNNHTAMSPGFVTQDEAREHWNTRTENV